MAPAVPWIVGSESAIDAGALAAAGAWWPTATTWRATSGVAPTRPFTASVLMLPFRSSSRARPVASSRSPPSTSATYPRRNDSESINRNLEDTLWLGRAHSIGHTRQHLNLLGYALMVNGLALHRHRRHRPALAA